MKYRMARIYDNNKGCGNCSWGWRISVGEYDIETPREHREKLFYIHRCEQSVQHVQAEYHIAVMVEGQNSSTIFKKVGGRKRKGTDIWEYLKNLIRFMRWTRHGNTGICKGMT
jgi:hypothetical protein